MEWQTILICLWINALIGAVAFEWAWMKMKPFRDNNEKRDSQFPEFRRTDVQNWSRSKFFLGAVTFMPLRFIAGIGFNIFLFFIVK